MDRIEEWLRARRRYVLGTIVACSLLVRIVYFIQISQGPCIHEHLWPQWDMEFFDRWARTIAAGDWRGATPLHPFHPWHGDVAAAYFRGHAADPLAPRFAEATDDAAREAVERSLWERWYGGTRFHQEPLYPYAIALTYRVLGADVRFVFVAQLLLGIGSNLLVYALARRSFGELVAAVAGALAVACSPALYYEMILLRTASLGFLLLAVGFLTSLALERRSRRLWLANGALIGLGMLLQSSCVVLLAGVAGLLLLQARDSGARILRQAAALFAGVALPLALLAARNLSVGAPVLSVTSTAAVTFVCSNASDIRPDAGFMLSRFTALVMGDANGRFLPAVVATLRTHGGVGSFLALQLGKLAALFTWYEIPNNTNFYFFALHAPILRWLPVTFTLAGPFGLLGVALAARDRRARVLHVVLLSAVAPMLVFYVLSRFRAPFLLALLPFAALALVCCARWLLGGRFAQGLVLLALALLLMAWTSRPLPAGRPRIRIQDHSVTYEIHYGPRATEAEEREDWAGAADTLEEFLRLEPDEVRAWSPLDPPRSRSEATFAAWYAAVHARRADDLERGGRRDAARSERSRAAVLEEASRAEPAP